MNYLYKDVYTTLYFAIVERKRIHSFSLIYKRRKHTYLYSSIREKKEIELQSN